MLFVGPDEGDMACGEIGSGRMAESRNRSPPSKRLFRDTSCDGRLAGRRALVTAGPTHEPIDPVRYIANRSSGKQGYAIAAGARAMRRGYDAGLRAAALADPGGVSVDVQTAREMLAACEAALPADAAVCAAAVADWRRRSGGGQKIKKSGRRAPTLTLVENPTFWRRSASPSTGRPL